MSVKNDLSMISKITDNIYLSGIFPMDENSETIKQLNIKYILACVDRNYTADIHNKIMSENPDITILYLPYNDDTKQNLWVHNNNFIKIIKYTSSTDDYNKLRTVVNLYNNKPLIEIGYHFIENAVKSGNNVLVHCMAGISRSVSLVTYYLMKKYHVSYNTAIDYIKTRRSIANPNECFKIQLIQYQSKRDQFKVNDADMIITKLNKKS